MPRLIWSLASLADVQRLYCFLATTKLDAAQHAVKAISDEVTVMAHQPSIAPLEDLPGEFREWIIDLGGSG